MAGPSASSELLKGWPFQAVLNRGEEVEPFLPLVQRHEFGKEAVFNRGQFFPSAEGVSPSVPYRRPE